jgi:hypothetical protein
MSGSERVGTPRRGTKPRKDDAVRVAGNQSRQHPGRGGARPRGGGRFGESVSAELTGEHNLAEAAGTQRCVHGSHDWPFFEGKEAWRGTFRVTVASVAGRGRGKRHEPQGREQDATSLQGMFECRRGGEKPRGRTVSRRFGEGAPIECVGDGGAENPTRGDRTDGESHSRPPVRFGESRQPLRRMSVPSSLRSDVATHRRAQDDPRA